VKYLPASKMSKNKGHQPFFIPETAAKDLGYGIGHFRTNGGAEFNERQLLNSLRENLNEHPHNLFVVRNSEIMFMLTTTK